MSTNTTELIKVINNHAVAINTLIDKVNLQLSLIYGIYLVFLIVGIFSLIKIVSSKIKITVVKEAK